MVHSLPLRSCESSMSVKENPDGKYIHTHAYIYMYVYLDLFLWPRNTLYATHRFYMLNILLAIESKENLTFLQ